MLACALPLGKVAKLYAEDSGLDFIETAIPAGFAADIFGGLAVVAKGAEARGEFGGIGDNHSSVAVSTEIFCGIEAEAGNIAERTGRTAFVGSADGLGVIFNDAKVMGASEIQNRIHVGGEAV